MTRKSGSEHRRNRPDASLDLNALADAVARTVDGLGTARFYESLLDILGLAAPHDLAAMVRYSRTAPPDLILPQVEPNAAIKAYLGSYYAFDPFYSHWKDRGETGVFQLRAIDTRIGRSRYAREFLTAMAIHDEIAMFLPPLGDASPTLILDRATTPFNKTEVDRVRRLYPLVAALHRQHLSIFVANGIDTGISPFGQERAMRLLDRDGRQVFVTQAWSKIAAERDPGFDEALGIVASRGPCSTKLSGQRMLRRTQLPSDFGPAPAGVCDEITPDDGPVGASPADGLPPGLADRLTQREQQVVVLTLCGYPIVEVARRLGLSRGTVKNHRLNIYRKLDITTERELFGEYLASIRDQ